MIQVVRSVVRFTDIQSTLFQIVHFDHLALHLADQLLSQTHSAIGSTHRHGGDVSHFRVILITTRLAGNTFMLHFTQNIANNLVLFVYSHIG